MSDLLLPADNTITISQPSQLPKKKLDKLEKLGLYYNSPEPAIICIQCGFAINPSRASRHPGDEHHIPKSARWGLKPLICSLALSDPKTLALRPDGSRPHPHLTVHRCSACRHCGLRSVSEKVLTAHLRSDHPEEIRLAARQQARHWLRDHIQQGLSYQSWAANDIRRSWIVITDEPPDWGSLRSSVLLQASPDPIKHLARKLFAEERARLGGGRRDSDPRSRNDGGPLLSSTLQTNWMRRTGWEMVFKGARRDILISLTELPPRRSDQPLQLGVIDGEAIYSPARDECKLASIMTALDRLLDLCSETARGTDVCLRRWLRGRFPDRPYKAPFELVSKPSSETLYRKELKRCVCFWLRLFRLLPTTSRAVTGRGLDKHHFRALRELWVDDIWKAERSASVGPPVDDNSSEDESSDGEEEDEEEEEEEQDDEGEFEEQHGEDGIPLVRGAADTDDQSDAESISSWSSDGQEKQPQDPAVDLLLRFCYFAITEDFKGGTASSTMLVYFSAVRGLSTPSGDEFLRPHRFTPILARLIYCSRLVFLEAVLPRFSHSYVNIARRPRYGLLAKFNAARREHMCDGTLSPVGEFLSLLSYGHALRRSQGPAFCFHWSDDGEVLCWDGTQQLSMANFRILAREVLRSATASCARLMYDWEPADIDLAGIRDRISTTTPGYSFISDPANQLTDAYLDLLLRACVSPVDGLLRTQGKDQSTWDVRAAQAYLDAHDGFLKTLMVLCNLDGGQCARIPELLSLEHSNTSSRPRGIYVWGASICSITRHHKARLTTNNEFYVARFFSPPVSRLLLQYLIYIRPVALAVLRKCFHHEYSNALLFSPLSQAGLTSTTSWSASTFTKELRRYCNATPGIPSGIGVQLYRQISIAITERHVRAAAAPFNRFDDTSVMARQDVAYAWQSGHRPMQRHTTYGLDGAFPDHLQPALLRVYAQVSAEWHAFLWGGDTESDTAQALAREEVVESPSSRMGADEGPAPAKRRLSVHTAKSPSFRKRVRLSSPTRASPIHPDAELRCSGYEDAPGTASIEDDESVAQPGMTSPLTLDPGGQAQLATEGQGESMPLTIGPFVHLVRLNLVACVHCKCAILAAEVKGHLLRPCHSRTFSASQRRKIIDEVMAIPDLVRDQAQMRLWVYPSPYTDPIPYIKPPQPDGLGCNECPYVVRGVRGIQRHYRVEHGWVNDRKRGGHMRHRAHQERPPVPWRSGVLCQQLCHWGHGKRWFEVGRPREERLGAI